MRQNFLTTYNYIASALYFDAWRVNLRDLTNSLSTCATWPSLLFDFTVCQPPQSKIRSMATLKHVIFGVSTWATRRIPCQLSQLAQLTESLVNLCNLRILPNPVSACATWVTCRRIPCVTWATCRRIPCATWANCRRISAIFQVDKSQL